MRLKRGRLAEPVVEAHQSCPDAAPAVAAHGAGEVAFVDVAEVAKNHALSVRDTLVAAGVPTERVLMRRPAVTLGGSDAAEARRVEVRVQ